jgi:hypothetical protein
MHPVSDDQFSRQLLRGNRERHLSEAAIAAVNARQVSVVGVRMRTVFWTRAGAPTAMIRQATGAPSVMLAGYSERRRPDVLPTMAVEKLRTLAIPHRC